MNMLEHHRRAIDAMATRVAGDPAMLALIIGGSITKGTARPDSDLDVLIVATDAQFALRSQRRDHHYCDRDICEYEHGEVDGKVVDLAFLQGAAGHGSEPARSAFTSAFVAYSEIPDLDSLVARIPVYQESERQRKIQSFYAQVEALKWFVPEAEKRGDPFLLRKAPADLLQRTDDLLASPGARTADAYCTCVLELTDWDKPPEGWVNRFIIEREWGWRTGQMALENI